MRNHSHHTTLTKCLRHCQKKKVQWYREILDESRITYEGGPKVQSRDRAMEPGDQRSEPKSFAIKTQLLTIFGRYLLRFVNNDRLGLEHPVIIVTLASGITPMHGTRRKGFKRERCTEDKYVVSSTEKIVRRSRTSKYSFG